ncbi:MAG: sigma-70 family RNA polymerase sigma factor [Gemmataceae bacterium]|nr:sigma-70 family RNA polymerase sigma factor [Gemmataceae bacterium]
MMPEADEFGRLVREWRAGSPAALSELVARYSGHIRAAVRRRLGDRLRQQYDSLDFVQDVWASVVALPPERCQFATPDALVGFLARVAANKVVDVARSRLGTQRRDLSREEALPAGPDAAAADRGPSPSQWAAGNEGWERLAARFPAGHRAVLERLRDGYTQAEIADLTGVGVRTVERIVRRIKDVMGDDPA